MPQSLAKIYIHLIFSTKNREPVLIREVRAKLNAYIAGILKQHDCIGLEINGVADHVHMLFRLGRSIAVAKVVEEVKTGSSKWLKMQSAQLAAFHWQSGYGAFSVSESAIPEVGAYIRNQNKHHERMSFQEEFRLFLKKHEIEFDERYVWD